MLARRQSSANAAGRCATATVNPLMRVRQPTASQRKPAALPASFGVRSSPSCSSQRPSSNDARPPPTADSCPPSSRTATSAPWRPTRRSGRRRGGRERQARRDERRAGEPPARLPQREPEPACNHQEKRRGRHCRDAQDRARQGSNALCRPQHGINAPAHHPQRGRLESLRHQNQRGERRRHHDEVAGRDGDEVRQHRVLLALVEVVGREGRDCHARDQRRQHDAPP